MIALVHEDHIEGVGPKGRVVETCAEAKRYRSLKRALNAAERWTWYTDIVRVIEVEDVLQSSHERQAAD